MPGEWLADCASLTNLNLANNCLKGPIPESLGKNVALTELNLSDNNLNHRVPAALGQLVNLEKLILTTRPMNIRETTPASEKRLLRQLGSWYPLREEEQGGRGGNPDLKITPEVEHELKTKLKLCTLFVRPTPSKE